MARTRQKRPQNNSILKSRLLESESEDNDSDCQEEFDEQVSDWRLKVTQNKALSSTQISDNNNNQKENLTEESKQTQIIINFIECESDESLMRRAFQSISDKSNKFNKRWISFEDLKKIESVDDHLFVIKSFYGHVFKYLTERNARIMGPLSLLYCYSTDCEARYQTIPLKSYPIFSQCMRKLVVSITNFDEEKRVDLINKINRMCATFSRDLTTKVTHLVSDSVMTKKYKVASSLGMTVVTSNWVDLCWDKYQYELCHANDQLIINQFRTPIFKNLTICVSQITVYNLDSFNFVQAINALDFTSLLNTFDRCSNHLLKIEPKEKNNIRRIVEENGGSYSGSLQLFVPNVILLLKEPNGTKFESARTKKIPCLRVQWLYDSVNKSYALPEEQYLITLK